MFVQTHWIERLANWMTVEYIDNMVVHCSTQCCAGQFNKVSFSWHVHTKKHSFYFKSSKEKATGETVSEIDIESEPCVSPSIPRSRLTT